MGLPDLHRPAATAWSRGRTALLLVAATLLAELFDLIGTGHAHVGPALTSHAGAELTASVVGVATAAAAGGWIDRRGDGAPLRRRVLSTVGALLLALAAHELAAVGLHAEHGAGAGELATHLAGTVVPLAVGLGLLVALAVGVRVVHRVVVAARRLGSGRAAATAAPASRLLLGAADVVPAGLLPALRLAGRAPPVALR